jgi:serine/threonine protein kinase
VASKKDTNTPDLFAGQFEIINPLGVGLVGAVYRARDIQNPNDLDGGVALKILRAGQDASLIKDEALILGQLWSEEENLKDGIHSIPRLIRADNLGSQPFLAMEFIRGQQVSHVLRKSELGYLDEAVALNIGSQLFRVLFILHEKINKTYSDLKIENFWWVAADERLKITDWNVLQDRKAPSPGKTDPLLQDLFRASVSLYWMLTGELPDFQSDLNAERIQEASNWGQLSDGVKDLLIKLLREESLKKLGTAYQIKTELNRLSLYWKTDIKALKERAKGQSADRLDAFSVLSRRISLPDDEFTQIESEIQESQAERNDLTRSIALFSAGSYAVSKTLADEAYPHASEPHIFLWWMQVIELAEKIGNLMKKSGSGNKVGIMRDFAVKAINAYKNQNHEKQDYQEAEKCFEEISHFAVDDEDTHKLYLELFAVLKVQNLCAQADETHDQVQLADEENQKSLYESAWKAYEEAFSYSGKVSSSSLLPERLSSAYLKNRAETLKNEVKVISLARKANESFVNGEVESARKFWREGFKLDIDHPKLVDSVALATQRILEAQNVTLDKLELAEELLKIIPSVVSNYSLACNGVRKYIQTLRQSLLEQMASPSKKISKMPLADAAEPKVAVLTDAKNKQSEPKKQSSPEQTDNMPVLPPVPVSEPKDNLAFDETSDSDDLPEKIHTNIEKAKETNNKRSLGRDTDKDLPRSQTKTATAKEDDRGKPARTEAMTRQRLSDTSYDINPRDEHYREVEKQIENIANEITLLESTRELYIDLLEDKVEQIKKRLNETDPDKNVRTFQWGWTKFEHFDNLLNEAKPLWQEAVDSPLEEQEKIIKKLKGMGFCGKATKSDFNIEFHMSIFSWVRDAESKESKVYYEEIRNFLKQQDDKKVEKFLDAKRDHIKEKIINDVKKDIDTNSPSISEKLDILWMLKADYPRDEVILNLIASIKKNIMAVPCEKKYPDDFSEDDFDYYYYLAHLNPKSWKELRTQERLEKWFMYPYIRAKYGEKIFEMKEIVRKTSEIKQNSSLLLQNELSGVCSFSLVNYVYRIKQIIVDYDLVTELGWTVDECVRWHEMLHKLDPKNKGK